MKVFRQGQHLMVRLPTRVVRELNLKPGDEIDIHIVGPHSIAISRIDQPASAVSNPASTAPGQ